MDIFIDLQNGNDEIADGTEEKPFRTIKKALDMAIPPEGVKPPIVYRTTIDWVYRDSQTVS